MFVPIPCELQFKEAERSGREFLYIIHKLWQSHNSHARSIVDLLASATAGSTDTYPATDLDILERALITVSEMLDRVLAYVRSVLAGEVKGDAAVGRYLMDTFGASTEELEKGAFNSSLQVSYNPCIACASQIYDASF